MTATITLAKHVDAPYEEVVERTKAALQEEGFGVLTEIDVQRTLHDKLEVDFEPYLIIGACNPPLAHRALKVDRDVGVLLPCNVVVRATATGCEVVVFDPEVGFSLLTDPELKPIAAYAGKRLRAALERI